MEVRILTEADAEAFYKIRLRALQDNPESFGASYEEILARGIDGVVQGLRKSDPSTLDDATFGAFDGSTLIGIASLRREKEFKKRHTATIWGMYVPHELRRHGVGKALLEVAIAYARTLPQLEKINLSVVLANKEARHLFISLGFETYGIERRALKLHDAYFDLEHMVLWLKEQR
jgi:ribosomal protein S18 acetylase RimI-like enzyme